MTTLNIVTLNACERGDMGNNNLSWRWPIIVISHNNDYSVLNIMLPGTTLENLIMLRVWLPVKSS